MRYILSPLSKSGEGVGGGVTLYLITSVSAVSVSEYFSVLSLVAIFRFYGI
ncbi:MAG: hypothetical protein ACKPER_20225 [Dolichospermum sp.]